MSHVIELGSERAVFSLYGPSANPRVAYTPIDLAPRVFSAQQAGFATRWNSEAPGLVMVRGVFFKAGLGNFLVAVSAGERDECIVAEAGDCVWQFYETVYTVPTGIIGETRECGDNKLSCR